MTDTEIVDKLVAIIDGSDRPVEIKDEIDLLYELIKVVSKGTKNRNKE